MPYFGILVAMVVIIILSRRKKGKPQVDYSFGLLQAKDCLLMLKKEEFDQAEAELLQLDPNDLTQTLDYLGLNLKKETFERWLERNKNSDMSKLAIGVFYLHEAWKARGYKRGHQMSQKQGELFAGYLETSRGYLSEISANFSFVAEAYWRILRTYMGIGETESAQQYYLKSKEANASLVWNYVQYSSAAQPKWGGYLELIEDLVDDLPSDRLIQYAVRLKLMLESIGESDNLFGGSMEELWQEAKVYVEKVDTDLDNEPLVSVHKYLVYNYMYLLANELKMKSVSKKYYKLTDGYYTLLPHGIMLH
jgi:hypothetical protein